MWDTRPWTSPYPGPHRSSWMLWSRRWEGSTLWSIPQVSTCLRYRKRSRKETGTQAAGKEMIKRGGGKIINISSQAGSVALPLRAAYCSSKGGVDQLTRTLALEWAKHKVLVNAVAPTFVETAFTAQMFQDEKFRKYVFESIPLGRMATPEEVACAALFLASNLANMITGHILAVDGGWTIQ
jgi:NAD(P)-dependent dehydrogenase (short-subunit alcohol dehydrogenase family)